MPFCWNLQLLTLCSFFRNLPCSNSNLLAVDADRVFVALNIFCVSRTIVLDIFNAFWRDRAYYWSFPKNLVLYCLWWDVFFLLIHFLVVKDYELPKSASHILSVPLNVECARILSWSISFFSFFNCLPDDALFKIDTWADNNALNSSCDRQSDLSQ